MSISLATMGKFEYIPPNENHLVGGAGGGVERRKPKVVVGQIKDDDINTTNKKIKILEVIEYDNI